VHQNQEIKVDVPITIAGCNSSNEGVVEFERALHAWRQAAELWQQGPKTVVFQNAPDDWYAIGLDAAGMLTYLEAAVNHSRESTADFETFLRTGVYARSVTIQVPTPHVVLSITSAHGSVDSVPHGMVERFMQQLFLALNITAPGSCDLTTFDYESSDPFRLNPMRLDPSLLDEAWFAALEEGWPPAQPVSFHAAWRWLHRDMAYDIEVAKEPTQKAVFGLLQLCRGYRADPSIILLLAQTLESLVGPVKGGRIQRSLAERLQLIVGTSIVHPQWFNQFYQARSRIVHGTAPIVRPGNNRFDPDARRIEDELDFLVEKAAGVLLALLRDMVANDVRAYRFDQHLIREPW
jgi:hypothetical protein